jgi:hypothetical protein
MGASQSFINTTKNDFELVIRASKELEHLLKSEFGAAAANADGRPNGLQGLIETACVPGTREPLPDALRRKMRLLGTVRNKLVHEYAYDAIEGRQVFIEAFVSAEAELKDMVIQARKKAAEAAGEEGGRRCIVC